MNCRVPRGSNVVLWTRFAANGTVQYLAACFVETAPFALQGARFRNNAHVFRAKAHVRKTKEANGVVCRNDVQSARLEPLGGQSNLGGADGGCEAYICHPQD